MDKKIQDVDVSKADWKRDEAHKNIYANNISLAVSLHDFQLRLATLMVEDLKATNIEVATVFLSPSHAKAVGLMLTSAVQQYEREHKVVLPLPPQLRGANVGN